jgi:hypothetical protein
MMASALVCCVAVSCNKADPNRFDISGEITFDGKPVPAGKIYFSPDTSKNNDGPQGHADIKDGRYDTRPTATGSPGGPVHVLIEGFDGKPKGDFIFGKHLFSWETSLELPRASTTKDFEVPLSAAKNVPKRTGQGP